jgi:hypothetical protein
MLGEKIEVKGKVMGQRVIDAQGPTTKTTLSSSGNVNGMAVNETVSYVGRPRSPRILHAKGIGVLVSTEGEIVTFTDKAI